MQKTERKSLRRKRLRGAGAPEQLRRPATYEPAHERSA